MSEKRLPEAQASAARSASGAESAERGRFYLWVIALAGVLAVLLHTSLFEGRGLVASDGIFNFPPWLESKSQLIGALVNTDPGGPRPAQWAKAPDASSKA